MIFGATTVLKWHPYAVAFGDIPPGPEWEEFKSGIQATKGNKEQPILFTVDDDGEAIGIDGRNRERACNELKIKPSYKRINIEPEQIEDFIRQRNVNRRHLTPENRLTLIQYHAANGESNRTIAGKVGTSETTVRHDKAKNPGASNFAPDGEPAKVTGKDGKTYTATRKSIYCERCQRTGPTKNCSRCADLRKESRQLPRQVGDEPKKKKRESGTVVFDFKMFDDGFGILMRQVDRLGNAYKAKESATAKKLRDQLSQFKKDFQTWRRELAGVH